VPLAGFEHLHADDARVEPRVAGVIDEDAPHRLRRRAHDGHGRSALGELARARRQCIEQDHLARVEAALLISGEAERGRRHRHRDEPALDHEP